MFLAASLYREDLVSNSGPQYQLFVKLRRENSKLSVRKNQTNEWLGVMLCQFLENSIHSRLWNVFSFPSSSEWSQAMVGP